MEDGGDGDREVEIARIELGGNDVIDFNLRREDDWVEMFIEVNEAPRAVEGNVPTKNLTRVRIVIDRSVEVRDGKLGRRSRFRAIVLDKIATVPDYAFKLGAAVDGKGTHSVVRFDNVLVEAL